MRNAARLPMIKLQVLILRCVTTYNLKEESNVRNSWQIELSMPALCFCLVAGPLLVCHTETSKSSWTQSRLWLCVRSLRHFALQINHNRVYSHFVPQNWWHSVQYWSGLAIKQQFCRISCLWLQQWMIIFDQQRHTSSSSVNRCDAPCIISFIQAHDNLQF